MVRYPAGYPRRTSGGASDYPSWSSRCLSATGIGFSGHPNPARGLQLSSQSAYRTASFRPDPVGVTTFHTREIRPGRVPPISRGRRCSPGRVPSSTGACRFPTASPYPLPTTTHRQGPLYETSTKVHAIHPSGLPLTRGPRMEREALRCFPELRTPPLPAAHVRAGPGIEHAPGTHTAESRFGPPICEFTRIV
jgi:hypothetical protein